MEYTPHNWRTGETVTSNKLNNIEEGISDAAREINELDREAIKMPNGADGQILEKDSNAQGGVKWVDKSSTGTEVEANPEEEATETLEKIKIGEMVYSIPEGIPSDMDFDQKLQLQANLNNQESSESGRLGYIVLQPEKEGDATTTFAAQIANKPNTIFEIRDVFDLSNAEVTIPNNCVLKFNGGTINHGTITGTNTKIDAGIVPIFGNGVEFSGTFDVAESYPQWFGAKADYDNRVDDTIAFQNCINSNISSNIIIPAGKYYFGSTLIIKGRCMNIFAHGAHLYYGGNLDSHFVQIGAGQSSSEYCTQFVIDGGNWYHSLNWWETHPNITGDVFHMIYAESFTMKNLQFYGGRYGFCADESDNLIGFYNGYFVNIKQGYATKDGFYFKANPSGGAQINAIQFERTIAAANGNPRDVIDQIGEGNGFVLSGTSFIFNGCNAEINAGYGIKIADDTFLLGCSIIGSHFENCLRGAIYIGKGNISPYTKKDIFIASLKCNSLTPPLFNNNNAETCFEKNIVVVEAEPIKENSQSSYEEGISFYKSKSLFNSHILPCVIEYKMADSYTGSGMAPSLIISMLIDGTNYNIVRNGVPHIVSSVSGTTIIITDNFTIQDRDVLIINKNHPCWRFGKGKILTYPIYAYVAQFAQSVTKSVGDSQVVLNQTTIDNVGGISAGDILVEYSNAYSGTALNPADNRILDFSSTSHNVVFAELPQLFSNVPDDVKFVASFLSSSVANADACVFSNLNIRTANVLIPFNYEMERLTPSDYVAGTSGKIGNLEGGKYIQGYAATNYVNAGVVTLAFNSTSIDLESTSSAYGVGITLDVTEGLCYYCNCRADNLDKINWAFYDSNGNYLSNSLSHMGIVAPQNAKFAICLFTAQSNKKAHITDIHIGVV